MLELTTEIQPPTAGPRILGAANALAAGAWTDIISITAPSEAASGQTVNVQVKVKNLATYAIYISTSGKYDDSVFYLYPEYANVGAGATYTFSGSFTMPNKSVRVYVWSYFWTDEEWYLDDSEYVDIAIPAWQKLATQAVTITPLEIWQKLATKNVTVTPLELWQKLATKNVTITPIAVWQKLASQDFTVTPAEIPPTFELIEETIYPYAYIYEGEKDGIAYTFKTDPFSPDSWIVGRLAGYVEDEVRKVGGKMLEIRVYVDKSPLLWENWKIEAISAPQRTAAGVAAIPWVTIIIAGLVLLGIIIAATLLVKEVSGLFKRKPGLEDVKVGWKKETLILCIQDSEEYWERTPTPIETLEGMSEEELRHYLNQIAEEEVPPAEPGIGLAVAAIGVLGLGALTVMAMGMGKPEERR